MSPAATVRRVVGFVPDLFFAAKLAATAKAAGVGFEALDAAAALERCRERAGSPDRVAAHLLILDLGAGEPALALARALRAGAAARALPMVGFYPHVDTALRDAALAAGVDTVLPRSAFVSRLPELLRGA